MRHLLTTLSLLITCSAYAGEALTTISINGTYGLVTAKRYMDTLSVETDGNGDLESFTFQGNIPNAESFHESFTWLQTNDFSISDKRGRALSLGLTGPFDPTRGGTFVITALGCGGGNITTEVLLGRDSNNHWSVTRNGRKVLGLVLEAPADMGGSWMGCFKKVVIK